MIASLFGLPVKYLISHGSHSIISRLTPWPDTPRQVSTLMFFVGTGVWAWRRGDGLCPPHVPIG